ncbi:MAG: DinB family protein [Candidatus Limnocylindrales bacterium]
MIDFRPVQVGHLELADLALGLTKADLVRASRALTGDLLDRLRLAEDADLTFVPLDPEANDTFADDTGEVDLAWTLGHVIVHLTASAEEAAFLAAELARGVEPHGRSRYEVPWPTLTTIAAGRARLAESQRMLEGSLDVWPDEPHLEVLFTTSRGTTRNALARFLGGLLHTDAHLEHVSDILGQARAARDSGG